MKIEIKRNVNDYEELAQEAIFWAENFNDDDELTGVLGIICRVKSLGDEFNILLVKNDDEERLMHWSRKFIGEVHRPHGFPCELIGIDLIPRR